MAATACWDLKNKQKMFGLEKEINAANLILMPFAYCSTGYFF
jgi:hypothetical protein